MSDTERETQIRRLATMVRGVSPEYVAQLAYDAGARIPDPPAPKAPEVVVSEEARHVYRKAVGLGAYANGQDGRDEGLRLAFPILLRDNPWAFEAEIRRRVEAYLERMGGTSGTSGLGKDGDRNWFYRALGISPSGAAGRA